MKAKLIKQDKMYALLNEDGSLLSSQQKITYKNCYAIEKGYNSDEIAKEDADSRYNKEGEEELWLTRFTGITYGFNKAEILFESQDKKYTTEDIHYAIAHASTKTPTEILESLQKREWDVEICCYVDTQGHNSPDADSFNSTIFPNTGIPKLDKDGFFIMRPILKESN